MEIFDRAGTHHGFSPVRGESVAEKTNPRRVVVVSDYPLIWESLSFHVNSQPDLAVCQLLEDPQDTLDSLATHQPDLLLFLLLCRDHDVVALIKDVRYQYPSLSILVVSFLDETVFAKRMLVAGATGFIQVDAPMEDMLLAIRRTAAGKIYMSPKLGILLANSCAHLVPSLKTSAIQALTDREAKVFELIGAGVGPSSIAKQLGISVKTVESYQEHIKTKMHYKNSNALHQAATKWLEQVEQV